MYICIYVYMYIYVYICIYMYICIYIYMYIYVYMYMYIYMYCIYSYMHICIYAYMGVRLANELLKAQGCSKVLKLEFLQIPFDVFRYLLIGEFRKFTPLDLHTDSCCNLNHWSQNASCGSKQWSKQPPWPHQWWSAGLALRHWRWSVRKRHIFHAPKQARHKTSTSTCVWHTVPKDTQEIGLRISNELDRKRK